MTAQATRGVVDLLEREWAMKYMMIVCFDPAIEEVDDDNEIHSWISEMDGRGLRLEGSPLDPDDATTVRVRGGQVLVSDGPFAETKEVMVGYDFLECANLDEAIEVASKHPLAKRGAMELRPFPGELADGVRWLTSAERPGSRVKEPHQQGADRG
jgi:hypothetical protein